MRVYWVSNARFFHANFTFMQISIESHERAHAISHALLAIAIRLVQCNSHLINLTFENQYYHWESASVPPDIDECVNGFDECDDNRATCTNIRGSYNCSCNHGYTGSGFTSQCSEWINGYLTYITTFMRSLHLILVYTCTPSDVLSSIVLSVRLEVTFVPPLPQLVWRVPYCSWTKCLYHKRRAEWRCVWTINTGVSATCSLMRWRLKWSVISWDFPLLPPVSNSTSALKNPPVRQVNHASAVQL